MAYLGQPGGAGQGLSVSGGVPAWSNPGQNVRTTYELDFGTVTAENPILSGAGTTTRTYNGVTWTFTNTTTGGAVSQVTSAAGLTQNVTPNTGAAASAPLSQLGVANGPSGPWRAWLYFDDFTLNEDNYLDLSAIFGTTGIAGVSRGYSPSAYAPPSNQYFGGSGPTASGGFPNRLSLGYPNYDILVVECVGSNFITRMGLYSSGHWTNLDGCRIMTVGSPSDATLASATSGIAANNSRISFASGKFSGSSISNRMKLFKMEVW